MPDCHLDTPHKDSYSCSCGPGKTFNHDNVCVDTCENYVHIYNKDSCACGHGYELNRTGECVEVICSDNYYTNDKRDCFC